VADVHVGAADARGRDVEYDVAGPGLGFGDLLQDESGLAEGELAQREHAIQPFTAPIVRPVTIQRWMMSVRMTTGRVMSTAAAPRPPKSICP